jgi:hypothetical protein
VLRDFGDDVERLGIVETVAGDFHGVVNKRKVARFELDVYDWSDNFDDVADFVFCCSHSVLLEKS